MPDVEVGNQDGAGVAEQAPTFVATSEAIALLCLVQ